MNHIDECSTTNHSNASSLRQSLKENDWYFWLENPEMSMSLQNLHQFGNFNFSSGKKLNPVSEYDEHDPYIEESWVLMDWLENLKD